MHHRGTENTENIFDLPGDLPAIARRSGEGGGYRQIKTTQSADRGRVFVVDICENYCEFHTLVNCASFCSKKDICNACSCGVSPEILPLRRRRG